MCLIKLLELLWSLKLYNYIMQQSRASAFYTVVHWQKLGEMDDVCSVYLTYFYRLGYLCAKNYRIWWRFDEVLTKTSLIIFWHTLYFRFCVSATSDELPGLNCVCSRFAQICDCCRWFSQQQTQTNHHQDSTTAVNVSQLSASSSGLRTMVCLLTSYTVTSSEVSIRTKDVIVAASQQGL